jgi:hypothetical protein
MVEHMEELAAQLAPSRSPIFQLFPSGKSQL